ncbi:hypothetical protein ES332_A03G025700v1 [Gossypium tomentosum]|uniref:Uncharacterized protein n=1 Tax=Gossypium tomentosum TaxID=34277 RepID=A0A5D2R1Y6_GOSTO|nr:hypothetical protein ES332_A03G025700v1 [Gossypium tomentosum]
MAIAPWLGAAQPKQKCHRTYTAGATSGLPLQIPALMDTTGKVCLSFVAGTTIGDVAHMHICGLLYL